MIKVNYADRVDRPIAHTDWSVFEITPAEIKGLAYRGKVTLLKRPGGDRQVLDWNAHYRGEGRWKIEGSGAQLPSGGRVPDSSRFPFSVESPINNGITNILTEWLMNGNKGMALSATHAHNGNTNGAVAVEAESVLPLPLPIPQVPPPLVPALPASKKPEEKSVEASLPLQTDIPNMAVTILVEDAVAFQPNVADPKFSGQPRKYFDEAKLRKLGNSMLKHGQKQSVIIKPLEGYPDKRWEIVDGERRWRAAQLVGLKYLKAVIEAVKDKRTQHMSALILNCNKEDFTTMEYSNALQEQLDAGETVSSLADGINKSIGTVNKLLVLQKLHPNLKLLVDPPTPEENRLNINYGLVLARVPQEMQERFWNEAKGQRTKGLILAKLNELCREHFIVRRRTKRNNPNSISRRVAVRFGRLDLTLTEFRALSAEEWKSFAIFKGTAEVSALMSHMTEVEAQILNIKRELSKARIAAKPPLA